VADNIRSKRLDELEARLAQMEQQEVASAPAPETTAPPSSDADTSDTSSLDLDDLTAMLDASTSALLAEAVSVDPQSLTAEGDLTGVGSIDALIVSDFLSVGGETVLTQAQVTTNLKVGTDASHLSLSSTSIATTCAEGTTECATLYLQPQGGRLNLLAGLMTLDETGTVTINGNLLVNGTITTNELAFGTNSSLVDRRSSILGSADSQDLTVQLATGSAFLVRGYQETTDPNTEPQTPNSEPLASIDASGSARFVDLSVESIKASSNTRGINVSVPQGIVQLSVNFEEAKTTDAYAVSVTPNWNTTAWTRTKTADGFIIRFTTPAPADAAIDWIVIE
jgi:hypothetical protein